MLRINRIVQVLGLISIMTWVVTGCGPLPKPFQPPPGTGPASLASADAGSGVRVDMLDGPPEPLAKLLAKSVADDLISRGIPAVTDGGGALKFTLKGRVDEAADPARSGKVGRIHWQLLNRKDEPFFTFSQDISGTAFDWQWGSPKLIHQIGYNAGRLIAEAVVPEDPSLKPVTPVAAGVWVKPIKGAPGDGDISLTRAIRFALMGAKIAVTSEPGAARHILKGTVRLGRPANKKQNVEVRWTVTYLDGSTVGYAVQRNEVPVGTFDGRWGETAAIVAAAAVGGIKNVLVRAEETVRFRLATGKRLKTDYAKTGDRPKLPPPELSPDSKPATPAALQRNRSGS